MSQNLEARIRGHQPPLPLVDADPAPDERRRVGSDRRDDASSGDSDWRLDEHTRKVGREGIAAARAVLRSAHGRAA